MAIKAQRDDGKTQDQMEGVVGQLLGAPGAPKLDQGRRSGHHQRASDVIPQPKWVVIRSCEILGSPDNTAIERSPLT